MRIFHLAARLLLHGSAVWARAQTTYPAPEPRRGSGETIVKELGPLLSDGAAVLLPSSPAAAPLLERGAGPRISPDYVAIVEVATEGDVQETIRYANQHETPFLAVSGAHGWLSTLNRVRAGIQISMRRMNHTRLRPDGKTASVGGGIMQADVTAALFEHGKQAVTGVCECVSVIGPLLGGGHSWLQSRHGFAADNLISARVVLADGSAVDVSADRNGDLFWALRGAGHNLGIVTSFDVKTYQARDPWTLRTLYFTRDKIEALFDRWNEVRDGNEVHGVTIAVMARDDSLDSNHPIIKLQIIYTRADKITMENYAAAFRKLEPVAESSAENIPYNKLYEEAGYGLDSPVCLTDVNGASFPESLHRWDPAAARNAFDLFSDLTADKAFAGSVMLLEWYGNRGVRAVPEGENAVAPEERRRDILLSPYLTWAGDDPGHLAKATAYGNRIREAFRSRSEPPHAYLNYASGNEELRQVYGRDESRIAKLKDVKRAYDPHNRFGFYMPIR
ncbi:hypothetical protein CDD83_8094 [Cordyceps sp. RAO-2017]|nr:hypothetical protein CDD83_8094 [Cordyceps sp. RAO-2017]